MSDEITEVYEKIYSELCTDIDELCARINELEPKLKHPGRHNTPGKYDYAREYCILVSYLEDKVKTAKELKKYLEK